MSVPTVEAHTQTLTRLEKLYSELAKDNQLQAKKILELIEKVNKQEVMLGFAGHFSAGKSTMINHIVGQPILPSSPIPTSANIVKLSNGSPATIADFSEDIPVKYEGAVDIDTIQAMCREGEKITGLEIHRPLDDLPAHVKILDTPGVDSTRDADRLITESSLHVMDYMYYVMDYNHVQSEVNLGFLLEMQQRKIPFSIIINQVDKHNEEELTFGQFKSSVISSLGVWGIEPENIYYTSLRDLTHPANQIEEVEASFRKQFDTTPIDQMALNHAQEIIKESIRDYISNFEEQIDLLNNQIEQGERTIAEQEFEDSQSLIEIQKQRIPKAKSQFDERVLKFISNAYLMPSELREQARLYLEAMQPSFKVGMIMAKKRTEEERNIRLESFYSKLKETIEKNVTWPLRERMLRLMEEFEITNSSLIHDAQSFEVTYTSSRLHELIESGASVTGEYVLRYTDQLSKDIQRQIRGQLYDWWEEVEVVLQNRNEQELHAHEQLFAAYHNKADAEEELNKLNIKIQQVKRNLEDTFSNDELLSDEVHQQVTQALQKRSSQIKIQSSQRLSFVEERPGGYEEKQDEGQSLTGESRTKSELIQRKAAEARDILKNIDGFENLISQLHNKQLRLDQRRYTIALFGAFSAGKSSFANALLGDRVLPVSPNPTTATINKITAPTEQHPHQTVTVKVKAEQQLLEDIALVGKKVFERYDSLASAYQGIVSLPEEQLQKLDHKKRSFLDAFVDGYEEMKQHVNKEITITLDGFASYVSEERKSCFIEWMELYYDCEWTRAGITLVDTPGADSVNARHTNVSFNYIKDADAILFVTYYNHPFSKADQSFLTQLGRVKDAFSMDKMFFIINAADLAENDEEKHQVENYLRNQLSQFHIRYPRIFSLSSLQGLKEKQTMKSNDSGLPLFEDRFEQFLQEELTEVLHHSIEHDLSEAATSLESVIENATLNEREREEKLKSVIGEQDQARQILKTRFETRGEKAIAQKVEKQLHFVHQRMMLNFNDYFKNHFNPASIHGDRAEAREQLREAAEELLQEVEFEMNQELKAVTLRIETFIKELVQQYKKDYEAELKRVKHTLALSDYEWTSVAPPMIEQPLPLSEADISDVLRLFKGTKSFFEQNAKQQMKDQLSERVDVPLYEQINQVKDEIAEHYTDKWSHALHQAVDGWIEELDYSFNRLRYSLEHPVDVSHLQEQYNHLKSIL
ncbi:dynamin family protein [Halobacillus shinanisalinarum]|uniref:Dynamin family protein n=1 Tax=Halobacillus shinanisalinarum TaxID=2932258 RepID=A0ABY4GZG7_9BACI|nr:dynamin family protein [Halobacillus shinanisalinarum]UOQ93503.1 dynamin family protein [Halobacillus shinanisalinarum]